MNKAIKAMLEMSGALDPFVDGKAECYCFTEQELEQFIGYVVRHAYNMPINHSRFRDCKFALASAKEFALERLKDSA